MIRQYMATVTAAPSKERTHTWEKAGDIDDWQ